MPRLTEVLKSVLVDLAQARAASDFFSADLATAYNADPVLRSLPVPRADISRYPNFTMRFSMNEVANLDATLLKYKHPVIEQAIDLAIEEFAANYNANRSFSEEADALLRSAQNRRRQERELNLLILNNLTLVKQRQVFTLERPMVHILSWQFAGNERFYLNKNYDMPMYKFVLAEGLGYPRQALQLLEQQGPEIDFEPAQVNTDLGRFSNAGDFDVDVDPAILQQLPDSTTSSITFSSNLRNYIWTEVINPETNEVELQLLPE